MLDQKQSNSISKAVGAGLIFFGALLLMLGFSLLSETERDGVETMLMAMFVISGSLLLIGGYRGITRAREKDKALEWYNKEINEQLANGSNNPERGVSTPIINTLNQEDKEKVTKTYTPDIITKLEYTPEEWKFMNKEESARRMKEGVWVSLGIGLLGGWIIWKSGNNTFPVGFLISLCLGVFVSFMKVRISNSFFSYRLNNSILITSNALIINKKFKTLQDNSMHLECVSHIKQNDNHFLEFSMEWMTSNGKTNDQTRIFIPERYYAEIEKVLTYYRDKGVKTKD